MRSANDLWRVVFCEFMPMPAEARLLAVARQVRGGRCYSISAGALRLAAASCVTIRIGFRQ